MIVDSSLWKEKLSVRVMFLTILSLKDADHICRFDAYQLHQKANLTPVEALEAIEVLKNHDTQRPKEFAQEFEGRRIQEVPEGFLVLNGQKYRDKMQKAKIRAYKTDWQANKREEEKTVEDKILEHEKELARLKELKKRRKPSVHQVRREGKMAGGTQAVNEGMPTSESAPH